MNDVRQDQYPTVIREMIRQENDVTNHHIMWLLVGQGFIGNAYVSAKNEVAPTHSALSLVGILVSLSAFVMLYQSYEARGYLQFLGLQAKDGTLREEDLPLTGWPRNRIKGWWRSVWVFPWFRQNRDLWEPWLLLPFLFTSMWMAALLHAASNLNIGVALTLGVILSAVLLATSCIVLVWSQSKDDESSERSRRETP
jgi:hypothetical protein